MTSNTIITEVGLAKIAAARAAQTTVKLTTFAVGDGNYTPTGKETKLQSEKYRKPINSSSSDPENKDTLLLNTVIPENVGGWYIREYGILDDVGDLIAIGIANEAYKPAPDDIKAVTISFTARIRISNIEAVEFNIRLDGYADIGYVIQQDELIKKSTAENYQPKLNYKPVQQGGGIDQLGNKIHIGYGTNKRIKVTVDETDYGNLVTDEILNNGILPAKFKTLNVSDETTLLNGSIKGQFTASTQPLETNNELLATTKFASNLKGNFKTASSVGATSTLSVADMGKVIENVATTPNINLILPNVSTVPSGSVVGLYNASTYGMTISTTANQQINNGTQHAVTIAIPSGGSCILYTDQASWTMIALGGSMVATHADIAILVGQISTLTNQPFGISQNWQNYDVATARGFNITYTNTTSKAIVVQVQGTSTTAAPSIYPIVNGVTLAGNGGSTNPGELMFNITIVPAGQTYQMQASNIVLNRWSELR